MYKDIELVTVLGNFLGLFFGTLLWALIICYAIVPVISSYWAFPHLTYWESWRLGLIILLIRSCNPYFDKVR
jgi:hypothetical protein